VEERTRDIGDGLQQVVGVLSQAGNDEDLEATADRVMSGRPEVADDRALLLVRLGEASLASAVHALPCDPAAAGAARNLVSQVLDRWGCAHLSDPATLVTSEFVSNAVRHSRRDAEGGSFLLQLRRGAEAVWVEVHDADPRLPSPRRTSALDDGGRGLQIVDVIARRWGARRTSSGKALWAELPR
jgi:anti-sigma regulatory factor (Ser/Thr protein kinase)